MKRILAFIMAFCMILSAGVFAAIELPLSVYVDGSKVIFPDAEPFVDSNSRTLVPVRFVSEALNASVAWDGNLRQVTITKDAKVVTLVIDKKEITVNGETKVLDSAPIISDSRTFVPIRFVSEALDAKVEWDGAVRTVYISTKGFGEHANVENLTLNGFVIPVKSNEVLVESGSDTLIKKNSGVAIEYKKDTGYLLTITYYRSSENNPDLAQQEIVEVLSQKFSSTQINAFSDYLSKTLNDKNNKERYTFSENSLCVRASSSRSEVLVNIFEENA